MTEPGPEPVIPTPEELEAGTGARPQPPVTRGQARSESKRGRPFRYIARILGVAGARRIEAPLPRQSLPTEARHAETSEIGDEIAPDQMSNRDLAEPRLAGDAADLPKGKPVRIKRLPTDRIEPATPAPIKRATSGDMFVRQTAEDRGHRFETWGDLGIEPRTVGGRCQNCRRWAMVSYEVPENYTEAQAVMRYKGDAFNLPCQDRP